MTFPAEVMRYKEIAKSAGEHYDVPYELILSIMWWESGGQNIQTPNSAGAVGLMQIVPRSHPECKDLVTPRGQIECAAAILREYNDGEGWDMEGIEHTVASYYAGPGYVGRTQPANWSPGVKRYVHGICSIYERETKND